MGAGPLLEFGAAVIQPSNSHANPGWIVPERDGSFRAQNAAVRRLIKFAYGSSRKRDRYLRM